MYAQRTTQLELIVERSKLQTLIMPIFTFVSEHGTQKPEVSVSPLKFDVTFIM